MNNKRTGTRISKIHQQQNMTQANVPGISLVDLLAGERVAAQDVLARTNEASLQVLKKERKTKNRFIFATAGFMGILLLVIFGSYHKVLFQRGNPIPYLVAGIRISDERPYVEVGRNTSIYMSKRGECPELFEFVEQSRHVEFVEQDGSSYRFTNGLDSLAVSSEIYWKYFTVWEVPLDTLQTE